MKSPLLYLIRQKMIEGRRLVQGQKGKSIRIPTLGIRGRLLEHPSRPLHYVAVRSAASGAWRSQKTAELIKLGGEQVWSCNLIERIHRRVPKVWARELRQFLDLIYREEIGRIWLDTDFRFWSKDWPEWLFIYESNGDFEQFTGKGRAFRRDAHIYTGICVAGIVQQ